MKIGDTKMYKSKNGFTLLELLVVVLIIGILVAIALPQYQLAVLKSKYSTMKDIVRVVSDAQQRYYILHNDYAVSFNDLDITYPGIYKNTVDGSNIKINGGYCSLDWWKNSVSEKGIICVLYGTPKISYMKHFNNGRRSCRVIGVTNGQTNTIPDKICQQETGQTTPSFNTDSNYYYY